MCLIGCGAFDFVDGVGLWINWLRLGLCFCVWLVGLLCIVWCCFGFGGGW